MPHGRRPTIKDVALEAGTAVGTVSRVLNGVAGVTEASRAAVLAAVAKLGYEPDLAAQAMRTRSKKAVGFMVTDISNPLFGRISRAAETVLSERGYALVLANTDDRAARELELLQHFFRLRTDGVLLSLSDETNPDLLRALGRVDIPAVLLDRAPAGLAVDRVMTDHASGMREATRYLIGLGHRRIALIGADERLSAGRGRIAGWRAAHAAAGLAADPRLLRVKNLKESFGFQETFALLSEADPPTALIAGGNRILVGVLRALRQLGVAVPRDLSLVSCDDTEVTELVEPPITVIWRDAALIGRSAAELLMERLAAREGAERPARSITLPTELLVRASCGPPPARPG